MFLSGSVKCGTIYIGNMTETTTRSDTVVQEDNTYAGDFCWRLGGRAPKARVSSAVGARIEAPRGVGCGEGGLGRGLCPLPRKFFDFLAQNGAFWCILGVIFAVELK